MARDIHKKQFDEGTKAKLEIFKDYLREWLPVFLAKRDPIFNTINIFDFFSGPGSDGYGNLGTPLIILSELETYNEKIISKNLTVNLYFNEYHKAKFDALKELVVSDKYASFPVNIQTDNLDFRIAFERMYPHMNLRGNANLLFLDQNGIKHITEDVFSKIISLKQTDFLFFISSSTIKRFVDHPNIVQHIKLNEMDVENTPYHKIHRLVLDYYKSLIPENKQYYLAQFSLKKNAGLYGLIFGSGHVLGIEKFLNTCWSIDPERGEANFDIDEDNIIPGQYDLFTGQVRRPKKIEFFESLLTKNVLEGELKSDKEVYLFTIACGMKVSMAKQVLKNLTVKEKKIKSMRYEISHNVCKAGAQVTHIILR